MTTFHRKARLGSALAVVAASVLAVSACGSDTDAETPAAQSPGEAVEEQTLDLVGFAVIKSAYDALGEAFAETDEGAGVSIAASYGASGAQSRAVIAGQDADVVALSLTPDVQAIADEGLVAEDWAADGQDGIVSSSVVVIAVREGNPKGITGWDDIVQPGVGIVTADPGTSGSAKWNLLAAYSQALGANGDEAAAEAYLGKFVDNVVSWNDSGRTATEAFVNGTGDVLISYENEAIAARASGVALDYVVPDTTFLIENPAAVTVEAPQAASDFLEFVKSDEGQAILGSKGFRPVGGAEAATDVEGANDPADPFPAVELVTVADLGGWSAVNESLFDKENGLVAELRK